MIMPETITTDEITIKIKLFHSDEYSLQEEGLEKSELIKGNLYAIIDLINETQDGYVEEVISGDQFSDLHYTHTKL